MNGAQTSTRLPEWSGCSSEVLEFIDLIERFKVAHVFECETVVANLRKADSAFREIADKLEEISRSLPNGDAS